MKTFILHQLEVKHNNIHSLFNENAAGTGAGAFGAGAFTEDKAA